jgi:hypothetical protein
VWRAARTAGGAVATELPGEAREESPEPSREDSPRDCGARGAGYRRGDGGVVGEGGLLPRGGESRGSALGEAGARASGGDPDASPDACGTVSSRALMILMLTMARRALRGAGWRRAGPRLLQASPF